MTSFYDGVCKAEHLRFGLSVSGAAPVSNKHTELRRNQK